MRFFKKRLSTAEAAAQMSEILSKAERDWAAYLDLLQSQYADMHRQEFGRPMSKLDRNDVVFREEMLMATAAAYCLFFDMAIDDGVLRKAFRDWFQYYLSQNSSLAHMRLSTERLNAYRGAFDKKGVTAGFVTADYYFARNPKSTMQRESVALASFCMMTTAGAMFAHELSQFKIVK